METNEYILKITGSVNIPDSLTMDAEVTVVIHGQVVKIEHLSLQNGQYDIRYVVKIESADIQ